MSSANVNKPQKRFYIICGAVTLAVVLILLGVFLHQRARVAPVLELTVDGLSADTPAQAQIICRSDNKRYLDYMEGRENCVWVWCGDNVLYLARPKALHVDADSENTGFTTVSFRDEHGKIHSGYIIDPTAAPNELGRIGISDAEELSYDSVSMSIRVALKKGDIAYAGAVYLWEKGSSEVIAVQADTYTVIENNLVSFTDDGGNTLVCYVLDTKLD